MERKTQPWRTGIGNAFSMVIIINCKGMKTSLPARRFLFWLKLPLLAGMKLFLKPMPYLEFSVITNCNGLDPTLRRFERI